MASSQAILGIKCASTLNVEFLYYIMQMKRAELMRMGQQGTQSNLNAEMVRNTIFASPSLQEQEAIADVLGAMDDEIEALENQLEKTKMVKEGMMQDLLTGKVRLV
jgi:type I restriction enzyme S subunit